MADPRQTLHDIDAMIAAIEARQTISWDALLNVLKWAREMIVTLQEVRNV